MPMRRGEGGGAAEWGCVHFKLFVCTECGMQLSPWMRCPYQRERVEKGLVPATEMQQSFGKSFPGGQHWA